MGPGLTDFADEPPPAEGTPRPIPLGGFWALAGGGLVMIAALALARPATTPGGCSNYGGNGNGSPFAADWGFRLLLLDAVWLALIVVEQLTPVAWRHRDRVSAVTRAAIAVVTAGSLSCCGLLTLGTMCH